MVSSLLYRFCFYFSCFLPVLVSALSLVQGEARYCSPCLSFSFYISLTLAHRKKPRRRILAADAHIRRYGLFGDLAKEGMGEWVGGGCQGKIESLWRYSWSKALSSSFLLFVFCSKFGDVFCSFGDVFSLFRFVSFCLSGGEEKRILETRRDERRGSFCLTRGKTRRRFASICRLGEMDTDYYLQTAAIWDPEAFETLERLGDAVLPSASSPASASSNLASTKAGSSQGSDPTSLVLPLVISSIGVKAHIVTIDPTEKVSLVDLVFFFFIARLSLFRVRLGSNFELGLCGFFGWRHLCPISLNKSSKTNPIPRA